MSDFFIFDYGLWILNYLVLVRWIIRLLIWKVQHFDSSIIATFTCWILWSLSVQYGFHSIGQWDVYVWSKHLMIIVSFWSFCFGLHSQLSFIGFIVHQEIYCHLFYLQSLHFYRHRIYFFKLVLSLPNVIYFFQFLVIVSCLFIYIIDWANYWL